ncbi:MAG TPA: MarR family transcriptional regulator [bacterium]|nr:MarR family transcriptional regulator [bacterium]
MKQADRCAQEVLDVVPSVMRFIRAQMRGRRADLSVAQFRCLLYVARNDDASLGAVAAHLGLTAPSTSKLVDVLERRALLARGPSGADRRRLTLSLTSAGRRVLRQAMEKAKEQLAVRMQPLATSDLQTVMASMAVLRRSFAATTGGPR